MKATDLQIGDYVKAQGYDWLKVTEVSSSYACFGNKWHGLKYNKIQPIPLEKKHLIENGFKVREETDDTEFYYYDCYEINVSFNEGISDENIPPIIFLTIEFAEKSIAMPIEYVHELQQAMRIMGCKKEIKL